MGQILHGSAKTTEAVRREIQNSQESLRTLSKRYGINQKTVAKWKKRESTCDLPTGPKEPKSTVLLLEEEATIIAFRKHTLLPLVDCLYALQPTIPHLTRSSLLRCLQRHGISRLPIFISILRKCVLLRQTLSFCCYRSNIKVRLSSISQESRKDGCSTVSAGPNRSLTLPNSYNPN